MNAFGDTIFNKDISCSFNIVSDSILDGLSHSFFFFSFLIPFLSFFLFLLVFHPIPTLLEKKQKCYVLLHCFILIINRVMENRFLYKKQNVQYALKYSSLFTLQSRRFCSQFINLYYRYILQAIITSRDAAHADLTIPDIYLPIKIS